MGKKYCVGLTGEEQGTEGIQRPGWAYKQTHASLLLSDENQSGGPMIQEISRAVKVGTATVERVRRRCVEIGG